MPRGHVKTVGFATIAGAWLVLALAAPLSFGEEAARRPAYSLGQKWHLTDGVYELVKIERDHYVFASGHNAIYLSKDLVPTRIVRDRRVEWALYPPPSLSWPLEVGEWGAFTSDLRSQEYRSGVTVSATWKVSTWEDVQTPAGTFKALRIDYRLEMPLSGPIARPDLPGRTQWSFSTWYAPDARLIVKSEAYKQDAVAFQVASVEGIAPTPPAAATPVAPLTVQVRLPEDGARVTKESSLVAAVITSGKGVAEVSVTVNGVAHQIPQRDQFGGKSVAITVPIKLREGANAVVVGAREPDGTVHHELRTVTYEPPTEAAAPEPPPVASPPPTSDRWAVVIGIGTYERPEISPLKYSVADAEAVYQALLERAGFKRDNVLLLTDRTERKPTLRNIKSALGTFLVRSAKKDDLIVIFFAGHGAPEVDPRGVEADGLAKYLVPIDADPADLYSTALPMDELQTIFDRIEARRVVVLLDACYSGAAGGRTFASRRTRATRVDDIFLDRLTRSHGRAIITAARTNEVSIELPELGHGVFTHYLLQALHGAADLDRDGIVALQELYQYLEQQVSQKSRAVGGNQHPVMKGEMEGMLPLVKVSRTPAQR
jgi:hypothetical protein